MTSKQHNRNLKDGGKRNTLVKDTVQVWDESLGTWKLIPRPKKENHEV
jgi:hypothetical protein